jgi:F0F1-type ATP synthase membrane subunit c/vacuolar-type H+-ATPase subunit K
MMNRGEYDPAFEARLRTLRILWAAFLATVGVYALVSYVIVDRSATPAAGSETMIYIFFALGLSSVVASVAIKANFFRKAAREGRPQLVHTGLILAVALCEAAAILGFVALLLYVNPLAYLLYALAALAIILHFPRREQLLAVSRGKSTGV